MKWNFLARHMITNKVTTIHTCNACNKTLRKIQCLKKHIKAESVHHSQSQEMPSIAMVRAASATARGIFSLGAPRRIGLWWPWPGEEKHLQLAQLQLARSRLSSRPSTSLQQLVKQFIYLMYLFQIQILCLWFGLAGSSHSSRGCSESSWSLDLTGPFPCGSLPPHTVRPGQICSQTQCTFRVAHEVLCFQCLCVFSATVFSMCWPQRCKARAGSSLVWNPLSERKWQATLGIIEGSHWHLTWYHWSELPHRRCQH